MIGRDPEEVLEGAATEEAKEGLKSATAEAVERGAFGAPTIFVGEEMFWGNDRLHFVEAALREVRATLLKEGRLIFESTDCSGDS